MLSPTRTAAGGQAQIEEMWSDTKPLLARVKLTKEDALAHLNRTGATLLAEPGLLANAQVKMMTMAELRRNKLARRRNPGRIEM